MENFGLKSKQRLAGGPPKSARRAPLRPSRRRVLRTMTHPNPPWTSPTASATHGGGFERVPVLRFSGPEAAFAGVCGWFGVGLKFFENMIL